MAELTVGFRWAWSFSGGRATAEVLQGAISAYHRRHNGRFPSLLFIHPDHLVEGFQPPLGLVVEADRHMNRAIVAFAVPEDEGPAPLFIPFWVFPHLAPDLDQLIKVWEPIPLNGLSLLGLGLIALAMVLALRQLIKGLRGE